MPASKAAPARPVTTAQLIDCVTHAIALHGPLCDLNLIDVSQVRDFSCVFLDTQFNGDISRWDTSGMSCANYMFEKCPFNGDISRWNVGALRQAKGMFFKSHFNGNISQWNVAQMEYASSMFGYSPFNGDISQWNTQSLAMTERMFANSAFNGDIAGWNLDRARIQGSMHEMFDDSAFAGDLSQWHFDHSNSGHHRLLTENFKGSPPICAWEEELQHHFYTAMFGTAATLSAYLKHAPFNAVHFDVCCTATKKPVSISSKDYGWVKEQQQLGLGLGLGHAQLRQYAMRQRKDPSDSPIGNWDVGALVDIPLD